ncbi:MAG TPA: response regulator transcription factor [Candidatus Atribacteria bacterium]|jgi:two-component system response regulator ResD|nr:response regulator transcription factor [Atribacterota bacterium]HOA98593.1 response regulator transcription factor [Candidatus Atribacteria bacterium]HOQ51611.1 response regulator transcription factor [Candidatus Atribacteria bacterium]HPZ39932.1 response regulator transcription factor [Candidatus Atribacteria bacterium]HQD32517.1 response regulator transcription factor [Candidatus Atribacteria bacterium]
MAIILVVEDEESVRELLRLYLEKEGFQVELASDGEEALKKMSRISPDLVLLDLMLPKKDGWEVCREIRKTSYVPIIMLTARGEEFDKVLGLELGADDYVAKPFSPRELVARIKAVLRRFNASSGGGKTWEALGLRIDYEAKKVEIKGKEINLTPKEFELLWFLVNHPQRVYTREQLLEYVWGYDFAGDARTVDTHIKRLREKLSEGGISSSIKTVWGYGYKFEPER